jgi:hypothetical protein
MTTYGENAGTEECTNVGFHVKQVGLGPMIFLFMHVI